MRKHEWSMDEDGSGDLYVYCMHAGCTVTFPMGEEASLRSSEQLCRMPCDCRTFRWEATPRHPEVTPVAA